MYKIKHKISKCLWPVHIDMYFVKWIVSFWRFINHFPKIHGSVLRKITLDLLYFWEVYDVSLWETNYSKSMANKAEAVFPITYFKAAVIGRRFSKIVVLQCSFFALVKAWRNAFDTFYFSSLFISPACYFTKGWTPCQVICKVYDHKSW